MKSKALQYVIWDNYITRKQLGKFLEIFPDVPFYLVTENHSEKISDTQGNTYGTMITFTEYIDILSTKFLRD